MQALFALIAVFGALFLAALAAILTPEVSLSVLREGPVLFGIPLHIFFELCAVLVFVWIGKKLRKGVFFTMSFIMASACAVSVLVSLLLPAFSWLVPMIYAEFNLLALGILAQSIWALGSLPASKAKSTSDARKVPYRASISKSNLDAQKVGK